MSLFAITILVRLSKASHLPYLFYSPITEECHAASENLSLISDISYTWTVLALIHKISGPLPILQTVHSSVSYSTPTFLFSLQIWLLTGVKTQWKFCF